MTITFDIAKLKQFKKAYNLATEEVFIFEGQEFLKSYAKYLIEYLETKISV